ncbi:exonuclease V, chloroplastic [Tanacetum coccineum]|uniref:Exonuclease V, chloroplastic n=1 Tax=Tanacetum coccineum TaxID=301880 RepID=A0ABQ4XIB5_9ASTR
MVSDEIPQISSSLATEIPIEIVSDEEMSLIEAAFSLAFATKRTYNNSSSYCLGDIEDGEWCEKQKEFFLVCGKPKASRAMKVGSARHAVLEEEVITRVEVLVRSAEEHWALKMINFIHGTNQLILDGLTRELPLIGFAEGVCVVGVIDEIQMMKSGDGPTLVETKTRSQNNLPSEPQQRNARLQLMCYKYFWDNLLTQPFPSQLFLELFSLNPDYVLSKEIREFAIQAGAPVQTLNDVLGKYQYVCSMLPGPRDQLLLRYEYQQDQSLIGENEYLYDYDWVTHQIRSSIEFWKGEREASYALENERWKCRHCMYASRCPINTALISYNQVDSSVISKSTVNSSGHLERLACLEDKKIWEVIVTLPKDTRDTHKKCGAYGSCSNADAETLCLCLDEKIFKPVNKESWEIGDSAGGCVRRIPLDCKSGTNGFIKYSYYHLTYSFFSTTNCSCSR